jgi:hypothetical protein
MPRAYFPTTYLSIQLCPTSALKPFKAWVAGSNPAALTIFNHLSSLFASGPESRAKLTCHAKHLVDILKSRPVVAWHLFLSELMTQPPF